MLKTYVLISVGFDQTHPNFYFIIIIPKQKMEKLAAPPLLRVISVAYQWCGGMMFMHPPLLQALVVSTKADMVATVYGLVLG